MSRENVERVRGILEDFRADKSEFDAEKSEALKAVGHSEQDARTGR
jgi:hypothetical protein